ncbi:MAG: hypothetical protein IT440_14910 [Phycisphaeraceae bacterium]|nr:hypothetical protein [Phycisphaeraceae bacterium]
MLALIADLSRLDLTDEVAYVAEFLIGPGMLPAKDVDDTVHLTVATVHRLDFLLTWNLRHLANAQVARAAYHRLRTRGYEPPTICTPDELEG